MASQMADCQQDTVSVTVSAADYRFKASGYTVTFDGFTVLYEEATDEKEKKETSLPPLEQGQVLKLKELNTKVKKQVQWVTFQQHRFILLRFLGHMVMVVWLT